MEYFINWAEARALSSIFQVDMINMVFDDIICRFGVLRKVVTYQGKIFMSGQIEGFFEGRGIRHCNAAVAEPQGNGLVEANNKIIKLEINKKLEQAKGA